MCFCFFLFQKVKESDDDYLVFQQGSPWGQGRAPGTLAQQRLKMGHPGQPRSLSGEESNSSCTLQAGGCQTQSRCACSTADGKRAVTVREAATGSLAPAGCVVTPLGEPLADVSHGGEGGKKVENSLGFCLHFFCQMQPLAWTSIIRMTYLDLASQDKLKIFLAFKGAFEFYSKALCFAAIKIQIPKQTNKKKQQLKVMIHLNSTFTDSETEHGSLFLHKTHFPSL